MERRNYSTGIFLPELKAERFSLYTYTRAAEIPLAIGGKGKRDVNQKLFPLWVSKRSMLTFAQKFSSNFRREPFALPFDFLLAKQ